MEHAAQERARGRRPEGQGQQIMKWSALDFCHSGGSSAGWKESSGRNRRGAHMHAHATRVLQEAHLTRSPACRGLVLELTAVMSA